MKQRLTVFTLAVFALLATNLKAEEAKKQEPKVLSDWLIVTSYPISVKIGEEAVIKVKLKGIPDGYFIGGDMHFFRGPGYGGFLKWAKGQKVEAGKEYTFKYKVDKKTDMTKVAILFYVGPKAGYANKEKKVWLQNITVE